jgi:hypothetical protein
MHGFWAPETGRRNVGELQLLRVAVRRHGRDWIAARRRARQEQEGIVPRAAGQKIGPPRPVGNVGELQLLRVAVRRHGRDWIAARQEQEEG